jgi:pimeloyl-ACP methyl ester carboxylesterase
VQYETRSVTSTDGVTIGFRQLGHGPGLVLVQGTMGSAQNFMELAGALAGSFTVYLPDRRGRGLSPLPYSQDYRLQNDVEDLEALLKETGASNVFGLSSGAIIALEAALTSSAIRRLAIFEPPLFPSGAPTTLIERYRTEIQQGQVAAALITAMKAAQMGPPIFNMIPGFLLLRLTNMAMAQEEKKGAGEYISMRQLAPTLQYDFQIVSEAAGPLQRFSAVKAEVLLLSGSKSPAYLRAAVDHLATVLPHAHRVDLAGLNHAASWNRDRGGRPERVAQELIRFF